MDYRKYIDAYLDETSQIAAKLSREDLAAAIIELRAVKARHGRLFILGVGGSAGNASHSVNDFRKIGGVEAYAPTDNVSELTAWVNDASWDVVFREWLKESRLTGQDVVLVYSVGGVRRPSLEISCWPWITPKLLVAACCRSSAAMAVTRRPSPTCVFLCPLSTRNGSRLTRKGGRLSFGICWSTHFVPNNGASMS